MDVEALWRAYVEFVDEVRAGGFGPPAGDGRSAERILAQVAVEHERLVAVAEALLAGEPAWYVTDQPPDPGALDGYASRHAGLPGLLDRVAQTSVALYALAVQVRVPPDGSVLAYRHRDGELIPDGTTSWARLVEIDATKHLTERAADLRALRA